MDLLTALRLSAPAMPAAPYIPRLALVGAGGKSAALFNLARQLARTFPAVLLTTTTHLAVEQAALADQHVIVLQPDDLDRITATFNSGQEAYPRVILLTGPHGSGKGAGREVRLNGLAGPLLQRLFLLAERWGLPVLVEADGSRRLPLKAPAEHEPAIPVELAQIVDTVIVVAGLSGLGQPLNEQHVHRPEQFSRLSGLSLGWPVSEQALAAVLLHPQGGLKNIPATARRVCLLNAVDCNCTDQLDQEHDSTWNHIVINNQIRALVERLLPVYASVLVASLGQPGARVHAAFEPLAGVILAAGEARRFGQPKQLLEWQGEPLVRRAARLALAAGLYPVRVVVGAYSERVIAALQDLHLEAGAELSIINNPDWALGQSSSLKAGLSGLPASSGGALFLLCDQPFITLELLLALRNRHAQTLAPLVAPWCGGRRANPVLFDRYTFPELQSLQGDMGGRSLFDKPDLYPPAWVPWADERLLRDIDSPEDYHFLVEQAQ